MISFKNFLKINKHKTVSEDLVTFGNIAYPKFNQIVILAGGGGSGKGFVQSNLLGIEGIVFDVDEIKRLSLGFEKIKDEVSKKYKIDKKLPLDKFRDEALENPDVVSYLHFRLGEGNKEMGIEGMNIEQKIKSALYKTILSANVNRKPNLIFDSTTKRLEKIYEIAEYCISLGYNTEDIHLVWILNDVHTAMIQNLKRERQVPTDILFETHIGAANTMIDIIKNSDKIEDIIDGDIWIVFNKAKIDVELKSEKLAKLDNLYEKFSSFINKNQNINELDEEDLKYYKSILKQIRIHELRDELSKYGSFIPKIGTVESKYIVNSLSLKIKTKGHNMMSVQEISDYYSEKIGFKKLINNVSNIVDKINSYIPQLKEYDLEKMNFKPKDFKEIKF